MQLACQPALVQSMGSAINSRLRGVQYPAWALHLRSIGEVGREYHHGLRPRCNALRVLHPTQAAKVAVAFEVRAATVAVVFEVRAATVAVVFEVRVATVAVVFEVRVATVVVAIEVAVAVAFGS